MEIRTITGGCAAWLTALLMTTACADGNQQKAEALLQQANEQFEKGQYDRALISIDSLRELYPNAIDTRKRALKLYQDVELKRSQEELAVVDSLLEQAKHDYDALKQQADADRAALRATEQQLQRTNEALAHRDSLQTRFDVLCAKIKYIHKKQKEI